LAEWATSPVQPSQRQAALGPAAIAVHLSKILCSSRPGRCSFLPPFSAGAKPERSAGPANGGNGRRRPSRRTSGEGRPRGAPLPLPMSRFVALPPLLSYLAPVITAGAVPFLRHRIVPHRFSTACIARWRLSFAHAEDPAAPLAAHDPTVPRSPTYSRESRKKNMGEALPHPHIPFPNLFPSPAQGDGAAAGVPGQPRGAGIAPAAKAPGWARVCRPRLLSTACVPRFF
jgi:hypothetical protein